MTITDAVIAFDWIPGAERTPPNCSRIIVHRSISGQSYVDAIVYHEGPGSGLKPLCSMQHITHWMPMPDAPAEYAQLQASTHTA